MPSTPQPATSGLVTHHLAEQLATVVLTDFATHRSGRRPAPPTDWGLPVLACLLAQATGDRLISRTAALEWASRHAPATGYPGLFAGGLAGRALGFAHAALVEPRLAAIGALAVGRLAESDVSVARRERDPASRDYDLIGGAAGIVLAMTAPGSPQGYDIGPLTRYLARLCDAADLPRLRIGSDGGIDMARWTIGRINLGLGHGIPGVLAALVAAWPRLAPADQQAAAAAIRRITAYLVRHARGDSRGVIGWPFATPRARGMRGGQADDEPSAAAELSRQAWCYGTPGVAWQLAEAGRILQDADLIGFATTAMTSLAAAWDDDHYLGHLAGGRLTFCHGAAGVLALADAFALHTGLMSARRLAGHLAGFLVQRLPAVARLAATNLTVLDGATGVLAVLLSRERARRGWLAALGLR